MSLMYYIRKIGYILVPAVKSTRSHNVIHCDRAYNRESVWFRLWRTYIVNVAPALAPGAGLAHAECQRLSIRTERMQHRPEDIAARAGKEARSVTPHLQKLFRHNDDQDMPLTSLGEQLLPFFTAAMEACWCEGILIGLAGVGFLHSSSALLPFWGPPLLLFVSLWLFRRLLFKEAASADQQAGDEDSAQKRGAPAGSGLIFGVLALLDIGLIWLHIYSSTHFLLDPVWLLAFAGDILSLNWNFYQALAIVAITLYFCWRSVKLAQMRAEPGYVLRQMCLGLLILLVAILLRSAQASTRGSADDVVLVLLIPIFFYFSLSAHALARVSFIRRYHPSGLEGSVVTQERAILSVIGGVGVVLLLLAVLGGVFFSTAFFNSLQPQLQFLAGVYDWLVRAVSQLATWIVTPIFLLISWLRSLLPVNHQHLQQPPSPVGNTKLPPGTAPAGIVFATKLILPLLIILVLVLLVWLTMRRRRRLRMARNLSNSEIHESVWSWKLFWSQFKAFVVSLFRRFLPAQDAEEASAQYTDDLPAEAAARTIREMYRALLKKAAARGYVRRQFETPLEFQQRLDHHEPQNEPQLGTLTEAYALTRYGGAEPADYELATISQSWSELEQKWEKPL